MTLTSLRAFAGRKSPDNTFEYARGTITILIDGMETDGAFSLIEVSQEPGGEPPLHVHEREDETFYVLEGELAVWVGGEVHRLYPGDSILLPRGIPHTFRIKSAAARALNFISPSGFENWFRILGTPANGRELPGTVGPSPEQSIERFQELSGRLGVRILGPSPEF